MITIITPDEPPKVINTTPVMELHQSMKEQSNRIIHHPGRSISNASSLSALIADISPSSSHFFEVLYVGKVKVGNKRFPDTFIDDTLDKRQLEEDKKNRSVQQSIDVNRRGSHEYIRSQSEASKLIAVITPPTEPSPEVTNSVDTKKTDIGKKGTIELNIPSESTPVRTRKRSGSLGSALLKKPESISQNLSRNTSSSQPSDLNRTMVFLIGRSDVRVISPDTKKTLLYIPLKDIASSSRGTKHSDNFGFVCKEMNIEGYTGYIFKCQSTSVADEVVGAINLASISHDTVRRDKPPVTSCEHCPMIWYHRLCSDVDGQSDKKTQNLIRKRLELLPLEEQEIVYTKVGGADTYEQASLREHNELMMMLLRAHCESKQGRHVHDTAENRHEFLNQYLGGSSTIFMKAKRSLTSSFDQLLKRKGSRDDLTMSANNMLPSPMQKEHSLPTNTTLCKDSNGFLLQRTNSNTLEVPQVSIRSHSSTHRKSDTPTPSNESEVTSLKSSNQSCDKGSSMMDIFIKVGNSPKSGSGDDSGGEDSRETTSSWRQAIFNSVVTPGKNRTEVDVARESRRKPRKRSKEELRSLWKQAINQQILLVRMEKENARLKAQEEEASERRIKLDYDDLCTSIRDNMLVWDSITNKDTRKCDPQMVRHAIRQGVPRSKRGDLWLYLAREFCASRPPYDSSKFPNYNEPYDKILQQLTSQQHAILIDLGRTFPNHPYFSRSLGHGQLALFNLLKAYSLLDPEVGYCQGLSFVAGVLLLHMSEEQAFLMLRHLMFRRQLRTQYLPDMKALQIQLYQLSRLLRDTYPDLYDHFDQHEISPLLYAAPWLLTFFASQFPLGFVTRVFDLIFVESGKVLFRVALALLGQHKDELMKLENFEQIMDYLKTTVPNIDRVTIDKIMKQVFNTDVSEKLLEYEVEYNVLQEEVMTPRPETRKLKQLEASNKALLAQNKALTEQLEIVNSNIQRLETTRSAHMMNINKLESQARSLEVTVSSLGGFIHNIAYSRTDIEIPGEILRIITQINNSERRKSLNQNMLRSRGIPLRVIDDNSQHNSQKKYPLKSTVSQPVINSKSSNFFSNSHNQIIQQKLGSMPHDSNVNTKNSDNNLFLENEDSETEDLSIFKDTGKKKLLNLQLPEGSDLCQRLGRVLTEEERKKLRLDDDDNNTDAYSKSNSMPSGGDGKRKIVKSSQSSYELGKSESVGNITGNGIHPLDTCEDVSISFGGTTKLKTFKPIKSRNSSICSLPSPSSSNSSLLGFEDVNANKQIELKIVESQDLINKNKDTQLIINKNLCNNNLNHNNNNSIIPESSCTNFSIDKSLSNETERLIKSQLHISKPDGLLT